MPDKKPTLSPREAAMEAIANTQREQLNAQIKEAGGTSFVEINRDVSAGLSEDDNPDDAAAEAARKKLEAGAALSQTNTNPDSPDNADVEQLRLQQEQEAQARADEEAAARAAEQATQRAQQSAGIDPQGKYKLKINGREMEVSGEEVLRRAQKDVAADVRMEEANRVMREAQALQQSLQEQQRTAAEAEAAKNNGGNPDGVTVDPTTAKAFTAALFKGDEDAALTAFNQAVSSAVAAARKDSTGRGNATPVDPNAIAAQVRQQIAIDSALERSRADYPELYADPDIEGLAAIKIERAVKEGKPFVSALDEVAGEMASKFGWKKRSAGTPTVSTNTNRRSEKQERKESLEQPPSGPTVKTNTTEEPVSDVSATIQEMARARGHATT